MNEASQVICFLYMEVMLKVQRAFFILIQGLLSTLGIFQHHSASHSEFSHSSTGGFNTLFEFESESNLAVKLECCVCRAECTETVLCFVVVTVLNLQHQKSSIRRDKNRPPYYIMP